MKRLGKFVLLLSILLFGFHAFAQAVLLEKDGRRVPRSYKKMASNSLDFRNKRKVGVGVGAAGAHGLFGASIELNFSPEVSMSTHFGLSSNFQSFGLSIKQIIGGKWFAPYISGGFTRWYTAADNGPIETTTPGFLAENFLTAGEKAAGKFSKTLFYPAVGIQYMQLNGNWAGTSLYAEVLMLMDVEEFHSAPTGSLGLMYYF